MTAILSRPQCAEFIWGKHKNIFAYHINGLVEDCGISIALAMEIPQSSTKSLTSFLDTPAIIIHGADIFFLKIYFLMFNAWYSIPLIHLSTTFIIMISHECVAHWGRDKMAAIVQTTFQMDFLNENVWVAIKISLKFVPKGPLNNIPASDNGVAPIRRQAIIWSNDGLCCQCIYALLGLNDWTVCLG